MHWYDALYIEESEKKITLDLSFLSAAAPKVIMVYSGPIWIKEADPGISPDPGLTINVVVNTVWFFPGAEVQVLFST